MEIQYLSPAQYFTAPSKAFTHLQSQVHIGHKACIYMCVQGIFHFPEWKTPSAIAFFVCAASFSIPIFHAVVNKDKGNENPRCFFFVYFLLLLCFGSFVAPLSLAHSLACGKCGKTGN
jgi:hypothetical protein